MRKNWNARPGRLTTILLANGETVTFFGLDEATKTYQAELPDGARIAHRPIATTPSAAANVLSISNLAPIGEPLPGLIADHSHESEPRS